MHYNRSYKMNLPDTKQAMLTYLVRLRKFSKTTSLILAAVLIVIAAVAYLDAGVQSSRQLSKAKKLADRQKILRMLKTGSINSTTRIQPANSDQTARDESCGNCIGETTVSKRENHNRTVSEEMLAMVTDDCGKRLFWILDNVTSEPDPERALHSLPPGLQIKKSRIRGAGLGVWTVEPLPKCTLLGPYEGVKYYKDISYKSFPYGWVVVDDDANPKYVIDAADKSQSNWLRYINCASSKKKQNVRPFDYRGNLFYYAKYPIQARTELLVWYGNSYAEHLGLM